MAKIKIIGSSVYVISKLKLEDIAKIGKFEPNTLVLTENEKPIFVIEKTTGLAEVSEYGISFNECNSEGLAMVRIQLSEPPTKECIAEKLAGVMAKLSALEDILVNKVEEINARITELTNEIEID